MAITPFTIEGVTFYSYSTVAESDVTNLVDVSRRDTWTALDTTLKEEFLAASSRYIDSHLVFLGSKSVETQPLAWPRNGVILFGVLQPDNFLPPQLQEACALFAATLAKDPTHADQPTRQDGTVLRSWSVGDDSETYETGSHVVINDTRIFRDDHVLSVLSPFLAEEPEHLHPIVPGSGQASPLPAGGRIESFGLGQDQRLDPSITGLPGERSQAF